MPNELGRRELVVLNRLRLGHTKITHGHLMDDRHIPAACDMCGEMPVTVVHLLTECSSTQNLRDQFFGSQTALKRLIGKNPHASLSNFLRVTGLFNQI